MTVVSPGAMLPKRVQPPRIGEGSVVCWGAVLDVNVTLGRHTLVHAAAIVAHYSVLGDYATLLPGAIVAGKAVVGAGADDGVYVLDPDGLADDLAVLEAYRPGLPRPEFP